MLTVNNTSATTPSTTPPAISFSRAIVSALSSRIDQFTKFARNLSCIRNTPDEVEAPRHTNLHDQSEKLKAYITADTLLKIGYNCMIKDSSNAFLSNLSTLAGRANSMAALEETLTSTSKGQDVRRDVMASLSALTTLEKRTDNTEDVKILIKLAKGIQRLASNFDEKYAWLSNPTAFVKDNRLSSEEKISFVADFAQEMFDLKTELELYLEKETAQKDSGYSSPNKNDCITINNSLTTVTTVS